MNLIPILFLVAGLATLYLAGQQWWQSLKAFKPIKTKQDQWIQKGQYLFLWMVLTAAGLGLCALALVWGSQPNVFFSFFFPFLSLLAGLWVLTARFLWKHHRVASQFEPMMMTNVILFIFPTVILFFMGLEAIEPAFNYPLPKGIPFENPIVTFYAVFILSGAFLAYTLSERAFMKLGKKKGYVEDVFVIAFPAGILGSRLWYVWGQWELEFANQPLWKIFAIWEGGLAIMGGALGGALVGIL
ncbi:MAG: hypothetical protein RLZZ388_269, partial [Bacillota bacterium]